MHANEQTCYIDYAFNSSYIGWKQNKMLRYREEHSASVVLSWCTL